MTIFSFIFFTNNSVVIFLFFSVAIENLGYAFKLSKWFQLSGKVYWIAPLNYFLLIQRMVKFRFIPVINFWVALHKSIAKATSSYNWWLKKYMLRVLVLTYNNTKNNNTQTFYNASVNKSWKFSLVESCRIISCC